MTSYEYPQSEADGNQPAPDLCPVQRVFDKCDNSGRMSAHVLQELHLQLPARCLPLLFFLLLLRLRQKDVLSHLRDTHEQECYVSVIN